ncbi:MAG: nucleotidyltransferase [Gemmatimonadetes bacterium]|nr:MAG: nucleotidyltransferase [Gemmatimonadota bacterium]
MFRDRPPLPRPQALGPRADLGPHRPVRREDPAHRARARAVVAVPQQEGRVDLRARWRDHPAPAAGRAALRAAHGAGAGVPHRAQADPPIRGRHGHRSARGVHTRDRRRGAAERPLREGAVKVIVPLAGKGTRLLPLTKRVPKPLVRVAGRPVMDYVMDAVKPLDVDEIIVITGHLKNVVERYVVEHYDVKATFVEQKTLDGTAGAINLARPFVDSPVLIIFVDTLFEADLSLVERVDADGIIWAKEVEDYQRFGVIVTDAQGYMQRIVEKPSTPVSRLANIGLQYVRDWKTLFDGIAHVLTQPPGKGGEYYLTDAFQYMVDHGRRLLTAPVRGWYDCGKVDTLLETNRHLLDNGRVRLPTGPCPRCTIVPPVYIEDGVQIHDATVGPNVSLEAGSHVTESTITNSILGRNVRVVRSTVHDSVIGDDQVIEGRTVQASVLDAGELAPAT